MKSEIAVLFDLGNVLLPIDLHLTYQSFAQYSADFSAVDIEKITINEFLWIDYEAGLISDQDFRNKIKCRFNLTCSVWEFDQAFNALLLDWHDGLFQFLSEINQKHNLYLLSNTSSIHANVFLNNSLGPKNQSIFSLFKKVYLSFKMGLVKPNPQIYHQVIFESNLSANQILFFDDNLNNIQSANELGFMVEHINPLTSLAQIKSRINQIC